MAQNFLISADSTPVLDGWGYDDYWGVPQWTIWVKANVKKYGKVTAKEKFAVEWNKQDAFASPYNWAKYDKAFHDFLMKTIDTDISSILSSPAVALEEVVSDVSETASSTTGGLASTGKTVKYAMPIFLVIVLVIIIFTIYRKARTI